MPSIRHAGVIALLPILLLACRSHRETAPPEPATPIEIPGRFRLDPWALDVDHPHLGGGLKFLRGELELRADHQYFLSHRVENVEQSGTWSREGDIVRLVPGNGPQQGGTRTFVARISDGSLRLSDHEGPPEGALTWPYVPVSTQFLKLEHLSPAARAARVRSGLPEPSTVGEFEFVYSIYGPTGEQPKGGMRTRVEATSLEGTAAWKITITLETPDEVRAFSTTWLASDLRLLREESEGRVTVAVPGGLEVRPPAGKGGEPVTVAVDPAVTVPTVGPLLFLRACPAEDLDYEMPLWDEDRRVATPKVLKVRRRLFALRDGAPVRRCLSVETTEKSDLVESGEALLATAEERVPALYGMSAVSGVGAAGLQLVNPEIIGPLESLGVGGPVRSPRRVAKSFAIAVLAGELDLVDRVVDWEETLATAARELAPEPAPDREQARRRLIAYRNSLRPAELRSMLLSVEDYPNVTYEGDLQHFSHGAIVADLDCSVRGDREDPGLVVRLRPSLLRGLRHDLDRYLDRGPGAAEVQGARIWLWARRVQAAENAKWAAEGLSEFGADAVPVLRELARAGNQGAVSGLAKLKIDAFPEILAAWQGAEGERRALLAESVVAQLYNRRNEPARLDSAMPVLLEALGGRRGHHAADVIREGGPSRLHELLPVLESGSARAKYNALSLLSKWGPSAIEAEDAVKRLLVSKEKGVAEVAERALMRMRQAQITFRLDPVVKYPKITLYLDGQVIRPRGGAMEPGFREQGGYVWLLPAPGTCDLLIEPHGRAAIVLEEFEVRAGPNELGTVQLPEGTRLRLVPGPGTPDLAPRVRIQAVRQGRVTYKRSVSVRRKAWKSINLPPLGKGTFEVTVDCPGRGGIVYRRQHEITGNGVIDIPIDCAETERKK